MPDPSTPCGRADYRRLLPSWIPHAIRLRSQDLIRYGDAHGEDGVFPNLRRFMLSDAHALWLDRVQASATVRQTMLIDNINIQ
jgi:hypothetical protein